VTSFTDDEAEAFRRKLAEGCRGPVLLTWLEQLPQDRDERRKQEGDGERLSFWRARRDSNPQPSASKADALSS
jgi:hypothetical protein